MSIMKNEEAYPELLLYILDYCGSYMTKDERSATMHYQANERLEYWNRIGFKKFQNQEVYLSTDENVLKLLANGYENFKVTVSTRIWNEHKDELKLNLCPKCNKIARTRDAKQCRFCSHSWRENEI